MGVVWEPLKTSGSCSMGQNKKKRLIKIDSKIVHLGDTAKNLMVFSFTYFGGGLLVVWGGWTVKGVIY